MNSQQRMDRAHEIFARVWPDNRDDTLYDVAEEARAEFLNIADDFEVCIENVRQSLESAGETPLTEAGDFVERVGQAILDLTDIASWVKPMRELSERLESALEVAHTLDERRSA